MKVCSKCKVGKPFTEFFKNKRRVDGYSSWCKPCMKNYSKGYRQKNEESLKSSKKEYHLKNREKIIKRASDWKKAHPYVTNSITARRRASKRQATPAWELKERSQIRGLYKLAKKVSELTEIPHEVDHIVPIRGGANVQGLHCFANLQIIPALENSSKGNHWWPDMW